MKGAYLKKALWHSKPQMKGQQIMNEKKKTLERRLPT